MRCVATCFFLVTLTTFSLFAQQRSYVSGYETGNFEVLNNKAVPLSSQWISRGVEVVDGERFTFRPPAPQGRMRATGSTLVLSSPVFRLNRLGLNGEDLATGGRGGDTLLSRTIDLSNRKGAALCFSVQRTGRPPGTFNRNWSDSIRTGPETRVIQSGDTLATLQEPDELIVEFSTAQSGDNHVPENAWNRHSIPGGQITNNPAYTLFGGGGHRRGFHEKNYDSSLTRIQGLRVDLYDDGRDNRFFKVYIPIPSWMTENPEAAKNFRFRFRVNAQNNSAPTGLPVDDADDFYIDNIRIILPEDETDIEMSAPKFVQIYAVMPQYAATDMPVSVRVANNTTRPTSALAIYAGVHTTDDTSRAYTYTSTRTIPFLRALTEVTLDMPNVNITLSNLTSGANNRTEVAYVLESQLLIPAPSDPDFQDVYSENNTATATDTLHFADSYGYDPGIFSGRSDVPAVTGQPGKGLNLPVQATGDDTWAVHQTGSTTGSTSSSLAARFTVGVADTLYGYKAVWGSAGDCTSQIHYSVYRSHPYTGLPDRMVTESEVLARRCQDDILRQDRTDEYAITLMTQPVVLSSGTYWIVVRSTDGQRLELGGSVYGAGMLTTADDATNGANNISINLDDRHRTAPASGTSANRSAFLYRNSNSEPWKVFTPGTGNPAFAHLDHAGTVNGLHTYSRGTWIPMLRPYLHTPPMITDVERSCGRYVLDIAGTQITGYTVTPISNVVLAFDTISAGAVYRCTAVVVDRSQPASFRIQAVNARGNTLTHLQKLGVPPVIKRSRDHLYVEGARFQWYRNGVLIPGAVAPTFFPTRSGNYSVEVQDGFGCTTTAETNYFVYTLFSPFRTCMEQTFSIAASTNATFSLGDTTEMRLAVQRQEPDSAHITVQLIGPVPGIRSYMVTVIDNDDTTAYSGDIASPPVFKYTIDAQQRRVRIASPIQSSVGSSSDILINGLLIQSSGDVVLDTNLPGEYIIAGTSLHDYRNDLPLIYQKIACPAELQYLDIAEDQCGNTAINVSGSLVESESFNVQSISGGLVLIDTTTMGYYALQDGNRLSIGRIFSAPPVLTTHLDPANRRIRVTGPASTAYSYTLYTPANGERQIVPEGNELIDTDRPGVFAVNGTVPGPENCSSSTGLFAISPDHCSTAEIRFEKTLQGSSLVDTATSNIRYTIVNAAGHSVVTLSLVDPRQSGYYAFRAAPADNEPLHIGRIFPEPPIPTITFGNNTLTAVVEGNPDNLMYQWTLNSRAIDGATAQALQPTADGMYRVVITDTNGCTSTSEPYSYGAVSVADAPHAAQPELSISPNPASDAVHFHLALPNLHHVRLVVCDVSGRNVATVFEGIPNAQVATFRFSATGLPAGVYFCRLEAQGFSTTQQFAVVR